MQPTLRIDSLAGEAVTEFPSHNAMQIRAVKQQLQEVTGLPRFRQKLLRDHTVLGDDELVTSEDSPLQLVQMDFHEPSPEQPLLKDAVVNGWEEEVERLLCRPEHPDGSTVENTEDASEPARCMEETPLHVACSHGHANIVRMLLEALADVNRVCKSGTAEEFFADGNKHPGDLDATTPLGAAIMQGELNICRLLLERGAEPNQLCGYRLDNWIDRYKPLAMAVEAGGFGEVAIARLLWEFNANITIDEILGYDVMCKKDVEMVRLLSEILGAPGASCLLALAYCLPDECHPPPETTRLLLEARADCDAHLPEGSGPEGYASWSGSVQK